MVAWENVTRPKKEGGLGFMDLKAWNSALLAKTVWNISEKKDSLWIRWINHVYLGGRDMWEWTVHKRDSPLMKSLFRIKSEILVASSSQAQARVLMDSWFRAPNGKRRGAYDFFRDVKPQVPWAKVVWCPQSTPKHAFVLWLATLGRLKTRDRLPEGMAPDLSCPVCGVQPETIKHLLFDCHISSLIWNSIRVWCGIRRSCSTLESSLKWIKKEARGTSVEAKVKRIALAATVYHIWCARNRKVFEGEIPNARRIIRTIQTEVYRIVFTAFPQRVPSMDIV